MGTPDTILKTVRIADDSSLWGSFFQSWGTLPETEYRLSAPNSANSAKCGA